MVEKRKKTIRVCFLQADDLSSESRKRLYEASRTVQEATNWLWIAWYRAMIEARRDEGLREFLVDYARWKQSGAADDKPELFAPLTNRALKLLASGAVSAAEMPRPH
jgi:hypothetical protein